MVKKLKILHISNNDVLGGAARAVMRLHHALQSIEVDSKLLLLNKESDSVDAYAFYSRRWGVMTKLRSHCDKLPGLYYRSNHPSKFSPAWVPTNLAKRIDRVAPDIVHLHWINDGQMSLGSIKQIKQPIVWSMLDMWPMTGGCHYDYECQGYRTECGNCPVLNSSRKRDLSYFQLRKKKKIFDRKKISFVAISHWLKACAVKSAAIKGNPIKVIPPALDTSVFRPMDQAACRDIFGLRKDKFLILFGAINSTGDPRKGSKELAQSLKILEQHVDPEMVEAVVFGATHGKMNCKLAVRYLGRLTSGFGAHDDASMSALYSAVDVSITPSLQEAFGQTASEALACGTPVVAFKNTGVDDIVDHFSNGYLAELGSSEDLAQGILWVLNQTNPEETRRKAREQAVRKFDFKIVAEEYVELYRKLVEAQ